MTIHHKLSDGMFAARTQEELKAKAEEFLKGLGAAGVSVRLEGADGIVFESDVDPAVFAKALHDAESLCRAHQFGKAKRVLDAAIALNPLYSETHRLYAQVEMEQGRPDEAVMRCVDALRLDPRNEWALLLMGNLYGRDKKDSATAARYFRKALDVNPDNAFAATNLAAILLADGKPAEAEPILRQALKAQPGNLNAACALATVLNGRSAWRESFDLLSEALPAWEDRPEDRAAPVLRAKAAELMSDAARELCKGPENEETVRAFLREVEEKGGVPVRLERDPATRYPARLELARNYQRDHHRIVYKAETPPWGLVAHQLQVLSLWIDGDKAFKNEVIVDDGRGWSAFRDTFAPHLRKAKPQLPGPAVEDFLRSMHNNLVAQVMNAPLDLVVNSHLHRERPALRPQQYLSMVALVVEAAESARLAASEPAFPGKVVSVNRTLNLVAALQLLQLYGQDLTVFFEGVPAAEQRLSGELFARFREVDADYHAGDQFRLVRDFADALGAKSWFTIGPEKEYVLEPTAAEVTEESERERKHAKFVEEHADGGGDGVTAMMSMYMLSALERFKPMSFEKVREIATQFALLGMNGIDPNKRTGYAVPGIPGKDMGGYETLAHYYVAFALAVPEMLPTLGLPFDGAYKLAQQLFEKRNPGN